MKVTLDRERGKCIVEREPGDRAYYGHANAAGESNLLYAVKQELSRQGFDLIKKRMSKDGHMVDDMQQYLRSRDTRGPEVLAIFNGWFQVRGAESDYNRGKVELVVTDIGPRV